MGELKVVHKQNVANVVKSVKESKSDWSIPLELQSCKTYRIWFPKLWARFHKKMITSLLKYLDNNERAVALSANQMLYKGKRLKKRFFVIKDIKQGIVYIILNPRIIRFHGIRQQESEFCMSWINVHELVHRWTKIIVEYHNGFGEKVQEVKYGFEAQIWQHENDHLNGKQKEMVQLNQIPHNLRIGRNQDCPCGSGLKYKKCCGDKTK